MAKIQIRFEDRLGCSSLFEEVNKEIFNCVTALNGFGSGTAYSKIKSAMVINENIDYVVAIFDLDAIKNGCDMLEWEQFRGTFIVDEKSKNKCKANILYPNDKNYIGNRVVCIPVFFCFETLYLYVDYLYTLLDEQDTKFCSEDVEIYSRTPEILINCKSNKNIQNSFLTIKRELIMKLLEKNGIYEYSYIKKDGTSGSLSQKDLSEKHEDKLFDIMKNIEEFKISDIISAMLDKAVFNYELALLFNCKNIQSMTDLLSKLTFDKYEKTLKQKFEVYKYITENGIDCEKSQEKLYRLSKKIRGKDFADAYIADIANLCDNIY